MTRIASRYVCALVAAETAAGFGLAAPSFAAPSPPAAWSAKPYKPKSRGDFTGFWERTQPGATWDPAERSVSRNAPLTPEYRRIFEQRLADAEAGKPTGDPTASCLPQGMPRFMTMPYPMEVMQNPVQLNIFGEWNEQTRRIWIDGRPHPPADEIDPSYYGHSIGRWQGDVLIVETVGIRSDTTLESTGLPHSDMLTIKERLWLADDDTLKDEITLVDPKAYIRPWTVTKVYRRMPPGSSPLPYVCLENQRNPINEKGETSFVHQGGAAPNP